MSSRLNVIKNIFWLGLDPLLRIAIGIPLAGFVARHLGLVGYGEFHLALSFVVMFGVLANMGLNEVLTRSIAQRPGESQTFWSSVIVTKAGLLVGYVGFVVMAAWLLGYSSTLLLLILILGGFQGITSLENSARAVFMGHQQMKALGWMDVGKVSLNVALSVTILLVGFGVVALASVRLAVTMVAFAVSLLLLSKQFHVGLSRPNLKVALSMLSSGFRFATISAVTSTYSRVGFVLLQQLRGTADVALASIAMVLVEKFLCFIPAVQGALFPFFSRLHADRFGSVFMRALRYQALIAAGVGLTMSLLGPWVIRFVFPSEFWAAGRMVVILGGACVLRTLANLLSTVLLSQEREGSVGWISTVQCGVYILATIALVRILGVEGFAWAYLLSDALAVGLQVLILRQKGMFRGFHFLPAALPLSGGLAIFFVASLFPSWQESLAATLSFLALYPVVLVVTGCLSREDVRYFQRLLLGEKAQVV